MADLLDELHSNLGHDVERQLQEKYNLDAAQSRQALEKIGPLILGGLKRQMSDHGGEERLGHIVNKYGDQDGIEHLDDYFSQRADKNAEIDPSLGGLLGNSGHEAAQQLDQSLHLAPGMGAKLIPMLAPLVLGMLAKQGKSGGMGGVASMLDRDGDGNILDDVGGILFNTKGGGRSAGSGCLGMVLGRLLGGR